MSIFWLETSLDAMASGFKWSETKIPRKPSREKKWHATNADRAPLGPLPNEILAEIDAHWALSAAENTALPDTYHRLNSSHFTGAPFARKRVCDVFEKYAEGNCQIIPIKKFWSLKDDTEVAEPYYVANVYNAAHIVDAEKTGLRKVINPMMGQIYGLASRDRNRLFVRAESFKGHHLLSDTATSEWFCDDVFREAIEEVTPGTYGFKNINII